MSYRFKKQETIPVGIKRIADEQIESSIHQLTHSIEVNRDKAIHNARKHFKKLRALVRLVRDEVEHDAYKQENACFRDAGRELSDVRDAQVRLDTLDDLLDHYQDTVNPKQFDGIRQVLVDAYETAHKSEAPNQKEIANIVADLELAQARIRMWAINDKWTVLQGGLHRVYERGYQDFFQVCEQPTSENLHEWRKRVKYLWYHLRILSPVWPKPLKALKQQTKKLADLLGDDHDLAVLRTFITNAPEAFAEDSDQLGVLLALIQQRQLELQTQAQFLGQRIYAEKPKVFVKRMGNYWQTWRIEMAQPPAPMLESSGRNTFECANV